MEPFGGVRRRPPDSESTAVQTDPPPPQAFTDPPQLVHAAASKNCSINSHKLELDKKVTSFCLKGSEGLHVLSSRE